MTITTTLTPIPPPYPSRLNQGQTDFDLAVDSFVGAWANNIVEMNAVTSEVNSTAADVNSDATSAANSASSAAGSVLSATAVAGASVWSSGGAYAAGAAVVSPTDYQTYRNKTGNNPATDPANNANDWVQISFDGLWKIPGWSGSLPVTGVVAAKFTDLTLDDPDPTWVDRCQGKTWYTETRSAGTVTNLSYSTAANASAAGLVVGDVFWNSTAGAYHELTGSSTSTETYRAGKAGHPTRFLDLLVATKVYRYDCDGHEPKIWATYAMTGATSLHALGPRMLIGTSAGLREYNFLRDTLELRSSTFWRKSLESLGSTQVHANTITTGELPSSGYLYATSVTNVVAVAKRDAPVDAYGYPKPLIYAVLATGVSRIAEDGTVSSTQSSSPNYGAEIHGDSILVANASGAANLASYPIGSTLPAGGANHLGSFWGYAMRGAWTSGDGIAMPLLAFCKMAGDALGNSLGAMRFLYNSADRGASAVAAFTSGYSTGWLVGDIRRCYLANSETADRSVKAATLTVVGTPTVTPYTGGRTVYSGFSGSDYYQEASHADWNALGTGDAQLFLGSAVKWGTAGTVRTIQSLGDGASAGASWLGVDAANKLFLQIHNGTSLTSVLLTTLTFTDSSEHVVACYRLSGTFYIAVDGVIVASAASALTISNTSGYLRYGEAQHTSAPWAGGQVACVRISATSPTSELVRDIAIYENALNGGAACLLSGSSTVAAMGYSDRDGMLSVLNGTNSDVFDGLRRVSTAAHGVGTASAAARGLAGSISCGSTGAAGSYADRSVVDDPLERQSPKTVRTTITVGSDGRIVAPEGWRFASATKNDGTYLSLSVNAPQRNTHLWYVGGLTPADVYDVWIMEDIK